MQNWLNTADGRQGWASYFLEKGYLVYLTDHAERGRSPWLPGSGELLFLSASAIQSLFTAPEAVEPLPYPQANLHTQWPGTGQPGDPIFDAFYATQMQSQTDPVIYTKQNLHAYSALLDRIGEPAVLVTHSQAGLYGWQIGDARPNLVAGIVAIEPGTNPFKTWTGPPFAPKYISPFAAQPYGIAILPVAYDPPLPNDDPKSLKRQSVPPPRPELTPCIIQAEPARKLVNLQNIPVLQLVGEASFQATYSYCVAKYLRQAGVQVDFLNLGDAGIHGNGHFSFMEKNNLEIAEKIVLPWLKKHA